MVIAGASNIFFTFVGYDVIALGAEEAAFRTSVPIGTLMCLVVVTTLYVLMATGLTFLISWDELGQIPGGSTGPVGFAYAFEKNGMHWARYIVCLGAIVGIISSTGAGVYGLSRIFQTFSRERLFPPWFGRVNGRTGTPLHATFFATITIASFAFFADFNTCARGFATQKSRRVSLWAPALPPTHPLPLSLSPARAPDLPPPPPALSPPPRLANLTSIGTLARCGFGGDP